jgi:MYXO-CTERM domain-containing protein
VRGVVTVSIHVPYAARQAVAWLLSFVALTLPLAAGAQTSTTLQWRTYAGGPGTERITGVARASNGDFIVIGNTTSRFIDEPAIGSVETVDNYFIARYTPSGGRVWVHVYGSSGSADKVNGIAIVPGTPDEIYIVGSTTNSNVSDSGTVYEGTRGGEEAFLAKIGASDGFAEWFLYLSGVNTEVATGVVATGGFVYVTGYTNSPANFAGYGYSVPGSAAEDVFVIKVNPAQIADANLRFPWSIKFRLIAGGGQDLSTGIALDLDKLLVVGTTRSNNLPGPVTGFHGDADAFVAKVDTLTGALDWFTYVGGTLLDEGNALTVNPSNHQVIIAGSSTSNLEGPTPPGGKNAFTVTLSPTGTQLKAKVLGGSSDDEAMGVQIDTFDTIYIAGTTASGNLPVTPSNALDTTIDSTTTGLREGFVAALPSAGGTGSVSYFGGDQPDSVTGLSLDLASTPKRLMLTMQTASGSGFPTPIAPSAYDTTLSGGPDGYLAVLNLTDITPPTGGIVNDRPSLDSLNTDIDVLDVNDRIFANWSLFSHGSTLRYEWAIGTGAFPEAIQPFTFVDTATSNGRTGLSLQVGSTYFVTVRAQSQYGITTTRISDGVLIRDAGTPDAGMDAGTPDAGMDAGTPDAGMDAGPPDAGMDAGTPDAGMDAGMDAGADAGTDAGMDAGTDAGTDGGPGNDGGLGGNDSGIDNGEPISPIGCSCSSAGGAGLPLLFGLMILAFLSRRSNDSNESAGHCTRDT